MKKPQLTLEEKFRLLRGKNAWQTDDLDGKLPVVTCSDGPNGLRHCIPDRNEGVSDTTSYPNLSMIACSWDGDVAALMASSIADDCIDAGVDILLAPGVNIKRTPLCGRNFEYFSEDPYLAGELGYRYVEALQQRGVGATVKHFALNNAENYRHNQNSEADDRTAHEIYFPAFERTLEAKPWMVMCSYNLVNGAYASENRWLLKDVLRDTFGYDGLIVSDWWAVHNRARALKATLDLEMPYSSYAVGELQEGYDAGFITEEEADACVDRIFGLIEKAEQAKPLRKTVYTKEQRHENAVKIARECIVLLKNEGALPLKAGEKVDVFNNGVSLRVSGTGSAEIHLPTPPKTIVETLREAGFQTTDNSFVYETDVYGDCQIVAAGFRYVEGEGRDRDTLRLDRAQEENILKVAAENPRTVVLLYAGSAVDMSAWIDKVAGVVLVGYLGEGANEALADVLSGKVNPSGKLAETYPYELEDVPVDKESEYGLGNFYGEGLYVGYRYYDSFEVPVLFPFGYGLSYAEFEYSDLTIEKNGETDYTVSYTITNISDVDGKEISEVYIHDVVSTSTRPYKELKAFSKDMVPAHSSKRVTVRLDKKAFSFYNPAIKGKYVENGKFRILVGASAEDIRLEGEVVVALPKFTQCSPRNGRS